MAKKRSHLKMCINACASYNEGRYEIHISPEYLAEQQWDGNTKGVTLIEDDALPPKTIGMFIIQDKPIRYSSDWQE